MTCLSIAVQDFRLLLSVQTRATTTTRSRATAQTKAPAELKAEEEANQAEERPAPEGVDAPPAPQRAEPTPALSPPTLPAQPTCSVAPATAPAQQAGGVPEMPAMCMGMAGIADVSQLRAWAVLNGLGQAVPMAAAQHTQQAQAHVAASFAAQSQQFALMQLQMQRGFNPCSVMPAPNVETAFTAAVRPVAPDLLICFTSRLAWRSSFVFPYLVASTRCDVGFQPNLCVTCSLLRPQIPCACSAVAVCACACASVSETLTVWSCADASCYYARHRGAHAPPASCALHPAAARWQSCGICRWWNPGRDDAAVSVPHDPGSPAAAPADCRVSAEWLARAAAAAVPEDARSWHGQCE